MPTRCFFTDVQKLLQDGVGGGGPVGEEQVFVLESALGESEKKLREYEKRASLSEARAQCYKIFCVPNL
jgi:hypothetical protein